MKKLLLSLLLINFSLLAFAVPGVNHFIKDQSGEFVYYRDYSFARESYIGFLTYDESTFAVRYFAPATEELTYKNIELLFTINSSKDYIEMTGERFVTPIIPEDTEIINYIHDLIYEFSARRKKAGIISPDVQKDNSINKDVKYIESTNFIDSGFVKKESFEQFGGDVFIYYDYLAPIFNIKKIISNSGENLFVAIASGKLKKSEDKSFSEFTIIEESKNKATYLPKNKKPESKVYNVEKLNLTLDENWQQMEDVQNVFFYGDAALLYVGIVNAQDFYSNVKTVMLSSKGSFVPWNKISILKEKNSFSVVSLTLAGDNDYRHVNKFLLSHKNLSKSEMALIMYSVSVSNYDANRKYFSELLKKVK